MLRLRTSACSETGPVRRRNEDRALCEPDLAVFGVADGVGGLPGGAEAAQAARDAVVAAVRALAPGASPNLGAIVAQAAAAVATAGRALRPPAGIATTLTFGLLRLGRLHLAHAGDSRCYGFNQGRFRRLTEDHTVENDARRGKLAGGLRAYAPADRRAITRCLGPSGSPEAETAVHRLAAGDRYAFCTDGVTGTVPDGDLERLLAGAAEPGPAAQELVGLALQRGGTDNATAVFVFVDEV